MKRTDVVFFLKVKLQSLAWGAGEWVGLGVEPTGRQTFCDHFKGKKSEGKHSRKSIKKKKQTEKTTNGKKKKKKERTHA